MSRQAGLACPELLLGIFFEFNPQNLTLSDLFYKPDFGKSQDPEFRRTKPSMSRCILELPIDFPSIGIDPKAQRSLSKNATLLIL
jgi:hypothetical protein